MPLTELSEGIIHSALEEEAIAYPVNVVLSLQRERTAALLRAMRSQHVLPALSHAWGSERAYSTLLREAGASLTVLDVPGPQWSEGLGKRVRALSNISSVVVLVPERTDSVALFLAGAANVIPRDTPPRELAGRILAERRWLDSMSSPRWLSADSSPYRSLRQCTQQVLFDILRSSARPWCCHDLCLLLGTAEESMSRRALQARIVRLNERLMPEGISVDCTTQRGRMTFKGLVAESGGV